MRDFCKKLYGLVKTIFNFFVSVFSVLFFSSFSCDIIMKRVRNSRKHNNCVVMGNGPSLPMLLDHYKYIDDVDYFAVNFFCLSEMYFKCKPSSYILLDPLIFDGSKKDLVAKSLEIFNSTDWEMNLFIPYRYRKGSALKGISNDKIKIVSYNYTPVDISPFFDHFFFKHNLGMPWPENIVIAAIFEAINMGYKTIRLFGAEQSWLKYVYVDDDNVVRINLQHYNNTDEDQKPYLYTFLLSQARSFRSNVRLAEYARKQGVDIINNTPGSYLDAYRKEIAENLQCK